MFTVRAQEAEYRAWPISQFEFIRQKRLKKRNHCFRDYNGRIRKNENPSAVSQGIFMPGRRRCCTLSNVAIAGITS